jgi:hypothetical protein
VSSLADTGYAAAAGSWATLEEAQRAISACTALDLRVLAAWLPRGAATGLRSLAAWFELVNIEDRLAYLEGAPLPTPIDLGVLALAWNAAEGAQSVTELRAALGASSWGDPGSDDPRDIQLGLRFGWARRVAAHAPEARAWAEGAAAVVLAEELLVARRPVDPRAVRRLDLGSSWPGSQSLGELRARLPRRASWALEGVDEPADLWRAELAWWRAVGAEAELMLRRHREGRAVVVAAVALLGLDTLRVVTALAVAARAGSGASREVLDALS